MDRWNRLANLITLHTSSKHAFGISAGLAGAWAVAGFIAGPSRGWELSVTCGSRSSRC